MVVMLTSTVHAGCSGPQRIAIMAPPGRHYVEATWGAWLARSTCVPLCLTHPAGFAYSFTVAPFSYQLTPFKQIYQEGTAGKQEVIGYLMGSENVGEVGSFSM